MRTRTLGNSDLAVSVVGLGCNNFGRRLDADATKGVVDAAIDAGITLFDTAELYGDGLSEEYLGRALGDRRGDVVVATKFGFTSDDKGKESGSREYVRGAIERSLQRLGTDYVDLYQYHRPDNVTPIEETLGALHELVGEGKVRYVGSSNFTAAMVREADAVARERGLTRFVSVQNEYSWLKRDQEQEVIPTCAELGIGLIPFFPLASGLLTGKYRRGEPAPEGTRLHGRDEPDDATWDRVEALEAFAQERRLSLLDVAIGGLLGEPVISSVIAGATKPEQVRANVAAGEWEPSPDELAQLRSL
jgi:aryl-alcohol dehydrogenase-like predicted oxidoreductase